MRIADSIFSHVIPPSTDFLDVSNNGLTGAIPDGFSDLVSLEFAYLFDNGLTGPLPEAIGNLVNLGTFMANFMFLVALPVSNFCHSLSAEEFFAQINQLTGAIPGSIGDLDNLVMLDLQANSLEGGIPASITQLNGLRKYRFDRSINCWCARLLFMPS